MNLGGSVRLNPCGVAVLALVCVLLIYLNLPSSSSSHKATSGANAFHSTHGSSAGGEREVSLKELLAVSIEVAKRGGRVVKKIRKEASTHHFLPCFPCC